MLGRLASLWSRQYIHMAEAGQDERKKGNGEEGEGKGEELIWLSVGHEKMHKTVNSLRHHKFMEFTSLPTTQQQTQPTTQTQNTHKTHTQTHTFALLLGNTRARGWVCAQ